MSDSAILCDTEVTTAAAEKFTDASDGIRITYNKIKEANTELSESWKGKGGEYFTVMGNKTLKATEDSGIFTDEAAKTAFEIVHRFKEIDESSADILPDDFRGKCGLLDLNRNDPLGLGINFDSIPEEHWKYQCLEIDAIFKLLKKKFIHHPKEIYKPKFKNIIYK